MAEHKDLTGSNLHEPKGIASANKNRVYVSDGSGSGAWEKLDGFVYYRDDRTTTGNSTQILTDNTPQKFICNKAGLARQKLPTDASNPLWDTANNKHVPIAADDIYQIQIGFVAENYDAGTHLDIALDTGTIDMGRSVSLLKAGGAQNILLDFLVIPSSDYLASGGEINLTYHGTNTCTIHSPFVIISREGRVD